MPNVTSPLTDASIRARHDAKESDYVTHVLRGVASGLPKVATLAVGLGTTLWLTQAQVGDAQTTVYAAAGVLVAAATVVFETVQSRARNREDVGTYDAAAIHRLVLQLEARSPGAFSARRGTTWIVTDPDSKAPRVLDAREYADFKRGLAAAGLPLDEVSVSRDSVAVRRYVGGRLDAGHRRVPALETYDVIRERRSMFAWFAKGTEVDEATVSRRVEGGRAFVRPEFSASDFLRSELPSHDDEALPSPGM